MFDHKENDTFNTENMTDIKTLSVRNDIKNLLSQLQT